MIGIYKITSPSNKIYIGQSIDIKHRWKVYNYLNKASIGPKIYNSLQKYGYENHKFEIIEECSLKQLNEREIYWKQQELNKVNNNFDKVLFCELYDVGGGPRNKETNLKISQTKKGYIMSKETREKISETKKDKPSSKKGCTLPEEAKRKISKANKGKIPWNKGISLSEKTKKRMSDFWKGKRIGIDNPRSKPMVDLQTGIEYPSFAACIKDLGKARDTVYKYIKLGRIIYKQ
jgi:group I intron endonuclease